MRVTPLAAGALAILIAGLGIAISLHRLAGKGTGPRFDRLVRAHGNAVEHVPLVLVLMFLVEALGAPRWELIAVAVVFVVARFIHAIGIIIRLRHPGQFLGASATYTVELTLGVLLLVHGLNGLH